MNFRSKKWTVPLLLLLIFISVAIFIQFSMGLGIFRDDAKGLFLNSFLKNPLSKQSRLGVSISGNKLTLNFNLTPEDKSVFNAFVKKWFGIDEEIKTLDLEVDKNTLNLFNPILPADLGLTITDKSLEFKSRSSLVLKDALIKNNFEFASGAGKINVGYSDNSKYQLQIQNPSDLTDYATSSGILTISNKLEGLFKSLPQVATIELTVNGKNIAGKIVLK